MTRKQADDFVAEIAALDCGRQGIVEEIKSRYAPGRPFGVRVIHIESGNELAFAAELDEAKYILLQLWRYSPVTRRTKINTDSFTPAS